MVGGGFRADAGPSLLAAGRRSIRSPYHRITCVKPCARPPC